MITYTKETSKEFKEDMLDLGYEIIHYLGKLGYEGPAVFAKDAVELADIISSTSISLQYERYDSGYIVCTVEPDVGVLIKSTGA